MTTIQDLIAQLRDTPNWMKETYGSWKDCVLSYNRAPFEAADALEALQAENGANMATCKGIIQGLTAERDAALARLAELEDSAYCLITILQRAGDGATVSSVMDSLARLAAMEKQEPVASIYISAFGGREMDDWKCKLPQGRNELFAAAGASPVETAKPIRWAVHRCESRC